MTVGSAPRRLSAPHNDELPRSAALRSSLARYDAHKLAVFSSFLVEPDLAIAFRKQRVIAPDANVKACVEASATLAHDDTARQYLLAAEDLDAQALGF